MEGVALELCLIEEQKFGRKNMIGQEKSVNYIMKVGEQECAQTKVVCKERIARELFGWKLDWKKVSPACGCTE